MPIVRDLILLVLLVGLSLVLGGLLAQWRDPEPQVTGAVFWGTVIEGAAGVALAGTDFGDIRWARSLVEFVVWVLLAVLVFVNRRWASVPRGLWALLTGLAFADVAVAVLWR